MLGRVGAVPWDSLLSFPIDWEAGLKCAQVIIVIMITMTMTRTIVMDFQIHCHLLQSAFTQRQRSCTAGIFATHINF